MFARNTTKPRYTFQAAICIYAFASMVWAVGFDANGCAQNNRCMSDHVGLKVWIGRTEDKLGLGTCCDQFAFVVQVGPWLIFYQVLSVGEESIFLSRKLLDTTSSVHYDHDLNSRLLFISEKEGMTEYWIQRHGWTILNIFWISAGLQ